MEISEVRIKLMEHSQERLLAFCSITFDGCFVVRDVKIIKGARGAFVAMPSRKLCDRCPGCGAKNCLRASYCSHCGQRLGDDRSLKDFDGRAKLYADIAHPINSECRELIQSHVIKAYERELELARLPGYVCRYDDFGEEGGDYDDHHRWDESHSPERRRIDTPNVGPSRPHELGPHVAVNREQVHHPPERFGDGLF